MSYEKVKQATLCRVGLKQTIKSVEQREADEVIIAKDADPAIVNSVLQICHKNNIPVTYVDSKRKLGKTCGIEVGAATVALKM
ncbi:50S ribosomal protein L7ae-like protein [Caldalkalibacillus mannanilyticus]|uniref:50S ribosomal protein L7ae-like protein n=1 Tax=Caldalkalibacillus mannanilyticus TaxID=1418 RepID=UPI0004696885|nr:50S ribosomal protein L7ae-like protein [Caldalkalibacillus mannanilyticus]